MVMGAVGSTILALGNGYSGNFSDYLNGGIALVFGLASALICGSGLRRSNSSSGTLIRPRRGRD